MLIAPAATVRDNTNNEKKLDTHSSSDTKGHRRCERKADYMAIPHDASQYAKGAGHISSFRSCGDKLARESDQQLKGSDHKRRAHRSSTRV